jgi:2-polyprenyl-6-hydroxyphenyl methylase/3-demethylubiquinone-9 3-methyltransferase
MRHTTVDPQEIANFDALAEQWWDPHGPMAPLHQMNPVRLTFIRDCLCRHFDRDPDSLRPLEGLRIVDVGCGGGMLAEPLARLGASVVGIDAGDNAIAIARQHAEDGGLDIDYRATTAEELADEGERFDAVVSMEVLEHVADLHSFVAAVTSLARPGGALLLATLNRTARSLAFAIVGAEYVLRWLPRGTHDWRRFIRPAELNRLLRQNGAHICQLQGVAFGVRDKSWRASADRSINYLAYSRKGDIAENRA